MLGRVCSKPEAWLWLAACQMTRIDVIEIIMARIITFSQLLISITITYVDSSTDCTKLLTSVSVEEESFSEMWLFMIWISDETFNENFNPGWDLKWFSGTNDFITPAQISLPLQFSIFVWSSIVLLTNILLSEGCFVSANKLCSLSKSSSFNLSDVLKCLLRNP